DWNAIVTGHVVREGLEADVDVAAGAVHLLDEISQQRRGNGVIRAVHRQERPIPVERRVRGAIANELVGQQLRNVEQVGAVAVAADEVLRLDLRTVGGAPDEAVALDRHRDAAPDDRSVDAGAPQELRHLSDMPEPVRQIADRHRTAELLGPGPAELEVPDDRLAGDQELVHQDLPRPDRESALRDQPPDQRLRPWPDLEILVHGRSLAVEREPHPGTLGQPFEELVDELNEPHPERLERLVPLAVPVGMRYEVDD